MSLIICEYLCERHGRFEATEDRASIPDHRACPTCGDLAELVISAPKLKQQYGAVTTGKVAEAPPGALDTRAIADGMPTGEFKKRRRDERRKRSIMKLPRNVRSKVQV